MTAPGFLVREVPALRRKELFRLGLSGSFGLDEAGAAEPRTYTYDHVPVFRFPVPAAPTDRLSRTRAAWRRR